MYSHWIDVFYATDYYAIIIFVSYNLHFKFLPTTQEFVYKNF